jgi:SulP family sulfate permease
VLGYSMFVDALRGASRQRSWLEIGLSSSIAIVCLWFGYVLGIMAGLVVACIIFAFSYGRVGVVWRHATRASFSGGVERPPDIERLLRSEGNAIQLYSLAGYLFFGSSESLFETIRHTVDRHGARPIRFIAIDFTSVTGMDSSAVNTFRKLRNYCGKRAIDLVLCGSSPADSVSFEQNVLDGKKGRHRLFSDLVEALEWCEELLLASLDRVPREPESLQAWLENELGELNAGRLVVKYFERIEYEPGARIYRQGDPSDTIDLIVSGTVSISIADAAGTSRRVRRATQRTVVGEMGFFRGLSRSASIHADSRTIIYRIDRERLEELRVHEPDLFQAFLLFVVRTLSDRLQLAHGEMSQLR